MLKICLAGDNHGRRDCIYKVLNQNPACDYYFHTGDVLLDPKEIEPFIAVKGNNDWSYDYPSEKILEIGGHRILLFHGSHQAYFDEALLDFARNRKCDVVFYGHSHIFRADLIDGIYLINPGSCYHNRDYSSASYARVYLLDDGTIDVERVDLE